jgi:hypothetical protein
MTIENEGRDRLQNLYAMVHRLGFDGSVEQIGSYYAVPPRGIYQYSISRLRRVWHRYQTRSYDDFYAAVEVGRPNVRRIDRSWICVPYPPAEREVEFMMVRCIEGATLEEICAFHNQDAERKAAQMPDLTPLSLWKLLANRSLRERVLGAEAESSWAEKDANPTMVLPDGIGVMVPYPMQPEGAPVRVPPNPAVGSSEGDPDGPTTVYVSGIPAWLQQLVTRTVTPLEAKIARLEQLNEEAIRVAQDGAQATLTLSVIRQIIAVGRTRPWGISEEVQALDDATATLLDDAGKVFALEPLAYLQPIASMERAALAVQVGSDVKSGELTKAVEFLAQHQELFLNGQLLLNRISRLLETGYRALARGPGLDQAVQEIDDALSTIGQAAVGAKPVGDTPLKCLLNAVGSAISSTTGAVGSLPGPASLAGAMVEVSITMALPASVNAHGASAEVVARYRSALAKIAEIPEQEVIAAENLMRAATSEAEFATAAGRLSNRLNARFMTSPSWGGAMGILNLLGLLLTIGQSDDVTGRKWVNVIGGTVNTGLAAVQFTGAFASGGRFAGEVAGKIANGIGAFAAILSVVSGAMTFYDGYTKHNEGDMWAGGLTALGGAATFVGFCLSVPGLQAVGMIAVVGVATVQTWAAIQTALENPLARVHRGQLQALRETRAYKNVAAAHDDPNTLGAWSPAMTRAWGALGTSITNAEGKVDDAAISMRRLGRNASTVHFLERLGFPAADIEMITEPVFGGDALIPGSGT